MIGFKHLCRYERQRIEKYLRLGKSLRFIAGKLDRSVSGLADEIKNNSINGVYSAKKAEHKAYVKRKYSKLQCLKVAMNPELKRFVVAGLRNDDQSPEGMSGRLREVETNLPYASTKAIYKFVKSPHGRQIEKYLYSKAVKKKGGPKRGHSVSIDGRTMIDQRPEEVAKRLEFGHYEGDFIESGRDGTGSLLVIVERKTRYPFLYYLEDRATEAVNRAVAELLADVPIKSLTIDNDISFQKHEELSELIATTVFFCHPQAPHEKGTVENRNKAIRRYVKKRSDLSQYSQEYFAEVERKLRDRYMKCLNYRTPQEMFALEVEKQKTSPQQSGRCDILEEKLLV